MPGGMGPAPHQCPYLIWFEDGRNYWICTRERGHFDDHQCTSAKWNDAHPFADKWEDGAPRKAPRPGQAGTEEGSSIVHDPSWIPVATVHVVGDALVELRGRSGVMYAIEHPINGERREALVKLDGETECRWMYTRQLIIRPCTDYPRSETVVAQYAGDLPNGWGAVRIGDGWAISGPFCKTRQEARSTFFDLSRQRSETPRAAPIEDSRRVADVLFYVDRPVGEFAARLLEMIADVREAARAGGGYYTTVPCPVRCPTHCPEHRPSGAMVTGSEDRDG
jgi:hypothetical protein